MLNIAQFLWLQLNNYRNRGSVFSLLEVEQVAKCQNESNLENVESMCERRDKRPRLSIIRGGVKEVFYCPREINFFFLIVGLTYDTVYQLCYFDILWPELVSFSLFVSDRNKTSSLVISTKVRIVITLGKGKGL